jgi:hypothetical protein
VAIKVLAFAAGAAALERTVRDSKEIRRAAHRCCVRLVEYYADRTPSPSAPSSELTGSRCAV